MTRKQAKALAARVGREDPQCSAVATDDGAVKITDNRTGYAAILRSAEDWERRKRDAELFCAQEG